MANETEQGNFNTLAYTFARMMAPEFQKNTVMVNLMATENTPEGSDSKRWKKSGSLTAETVNESGTYSFSGNSELTDTNVETTVAKAVVVTKLTEEARRFGGADASENRITSLQGRAIARFVDNDALSLATGFSNVVTSTDDMTYEDLFLGQLNIFNADTPDQNVPLAFIGAPKAFHDLGVQAIQAGGSAFANDTLLGIFGGPPQANGYRGEIVPGIQGFQTTGFQTTGSDNQQLLIHPMWGLCGILDPSITVKFEGVVSGGFYDEIGSLYFYDVAEWNDGACVQMRSDAS